MKKNYIEQNAIFHILIRVLIILFLSIYSLSFCLAQKMPVPENIQAALLPKVIKYSANHAQKTRLRLLIVYDNNSHISQLELFKSIGSQMDVKSVVSGDLERYIDNCDLVYFMPGTQKSAIICKTKKVLSVTGISQYVEQGTISIAFGLEDNKPKIFVNLSSMASEEQSLSSEILRIAKVFN